MQRGGSLMFIATWSQDAGDGQDDRIVFVSTEGEVAVYEGSNPASAADWALVGVYDITRPLGPKCHFRAGGDLVIGTETGLIPLSAVTQKDPAAIDVSALSGAIEQSWRDQVKRRTVEQPMELFKWPRENMLMVSLPHDQTTSFVANIQTGAWCKYIGWDVQAATVFRDQMYIGDRAGFVYAAEVGGADEGPATGDLFVPTVGAWNLAAAVYNGVNFSVSAQASWPVGVALSSDGTRMFVADFSNQVIYQYDLSTAWDQNSASYGGVSFSVAGQISNNLYGLTFSADGTKMYAIRALGAEVFQYTLSTPWALNTASYSGLSFNPSAQTNNLSGIAVRPDGAKFYLVGSNNSTIFQYSMSTPGNISSGSYDGISLSVSGQDGIPFGIAFKPDGTRLYVSGQANGGVFEFGVSTAWVLSSAVYSGVSISVAAQTTTPNGIAFRPDGTRMYFVGAVPKRVYQYDLGTTYAPIALTGSPYICKLSYMPSDLSGTATEKTVGMIRARFLSSSPIAPQLSVATNYSVDFPPAPAATAIPAGGGSLWGVARWGVSRWGSGDISAVRGTYETGWISVGANGQVVAPQWQIVIDGDGRPSAELLAIDVLMELGGI
jgi:sugar lactone lactonase YvrE